MSMDLSICMGIGWLRFVFVGRVVLCLFCFYDGWMDGWMEGCIPYDVVRHANSCMHACKIRMEWNAILYYKNRIICECECECQCEFECEHEMK